MKYTINQIIITIFFSFIVTTIINIIANRFFPSFIPVAKSGFVLILLMIGIVLTMLFIFVQDKKFERTEIFMFIIILITMVGIFYVTKKYVPELYSIIPSQTKQAIEPIFSIFRG